MNAHFHFWPKDLPKSLMVPETSIHDNLVVAARRFPQKTAIYYYGNTISYQALYIEVEAFAGYLEHHLGVQKGDRVALYLQNSPQYVIAYYAILRLGAMVVPINPMNVTNELRFYVQDCQAQIVIAGQELYTEVRPLLLEQVVRHVVLATYGEYAGEEDLQDIPDVVQSSRISVEDDVAHCVTFFQEAVHANFWPSMIAISSNDLAVLPYTSGTTGVAKGCMHTHSTTQANIISSVCWTRLSSDSTVLCSLPLFHVTGMEHSMNAPIFAGSTMILMTRWNRETAAKYIKDLKCTHWKNIATMVVDFLANPQLQKDHLSSLTTMGGGGAPLPKAIGEKLYAFCGLQYIEGYGLSETMSTTHVNPPERPKGQCIGIPCFDVDARILHPDTLEELGIGEEGEVVVCGPQIFKGYWHRPDENAHAFLTLDGKTFFRTGDIGKYDEEGYFYIVDRVKRMINASGFKVWPTEVEAMLYKHPAVAQACVIGVPDARRGETVKAYVVLTDEYRDSMTEQEFIAWTKEQMAAYKYPRLVEFVDSLPISGSGKILWKKLQDEELEKRINASLCSHRRSL